jgi:predicted AAA+ superfamily ATPase
MTWYKELGFQENPFTIKPQVYFDDFFGHDDTVDNILDAVEEGKFIIVSGSFGTGKTSIMKSIIDEFKGERKVFYYNAYSSERKINYDDVLVKGGSFFSRLFGIKSKEMILLIDEAHNLMENNIDEIIDYYNDGYFRSVILVTSRPEFRFSNEVEKVVDGNKYILTMFSLKDAHKLVENRLEDMSDLVPKKIVEKIYKSSSTPREFLMKCEDASRLAVERGSEKVEEEDIR